MFPGPTQIQTDIRHLAFRGLGLLDRSTRIVIVSLGITCVKTQPKWANGRYNLIRIQSEFVI